MAGRTPRRAPVVFAAFLLAAGGAVLARRALADNFADARGHFLEGVRHFADGDFEGARRLFLQADQEHHAPTISYNLARAEERLGHVQAAVDAYERYLGEAGGAAEFAEPAAIAVADLRAHSGRLRIETKPPGARAFVDGSPLFEATPTATLVPVGLHHVVVEGDTWRAATDVQATAGVSQTVQLDRPEAPAASTPPPSTSSSTPPPPVGPPKTREAERPDPSGLVYGGSFVLAPFVFFGSGSPSGTGGTRNGTTQWGFEAAMSAEFGYAFTPRAEIVLRGLGGLGSTCHQPFDSHILAGGPAINYRVTDIFWLGASGIGGEAQTCRGQSSVANYTTGFVLSPTLDAGIAVVTTSYGQWMVTASASFFFADSHRNMMLYFPLGFGVRFF
jgi:hypothetical protein